MMKIFSQVFLREETMLSKLLPGYIISETKYREDLYTFEVSVDSPASAKPIKLAVNPGNFPDMISLPFMDEQVQIHEKLSVYLKDEALLRLEGWKDATKHTLVGPSPFKIGKHKKVFLGKALSGTVCISESFKLFILIDKWRFSSDEIKCILKPDIFQSGESTKLTLPSGEFYYDKAKKHLWTSNGSSFNGQNLIDLAEMMQRCKLV